MDEGLCRRGVVSDNGRNDISKLRASSHCSKCNCYIESVPQANSLILVEGGEPRVGKLSLLSIVVSVSKKRYLIDKTTSDASYINAFYENKSKFCEKPNSYV